MITALIVTSPPKRGVLTPDGYWRYVVYNQLDDQFRAAGKQISG